MDRARFSRIAHGDLAWSAPVDRAAMDQAVAALGAGPDDHAFDLGCGRGAFLLELARHTGCRGTGIDIDAESIRAARARADALGLGDRVRFEVCDAADFGRGARFDVAVCIGASHACGGFGPALDYLLERAGDSSRLLVGEGFWRKDPDTEYLAYIGARAEEMGSHWDNVETARARGLVPLWSLVTSDAAWDRYESLYRLNMARHLALNPDDPEHDAFRRHSERWYAGYLRWGRETMGFALYLFGKASA